LTWEPYPGPQQYPVWFLQKRCWLYDVQPFINLLTRFSSRRSHPPPPLPPHRGQRGRGKKNLITTSNYKILRGGQDDKMAFRRGLNLINADRRSRFHRQAGRQSTKKRSISEKYHKIAINKAPPLEGLVNLALDTQTTVKLWFSCRSQPKSVE
jgi:hypothetical protein